MTTPVSSRPVLVVTNLVPPDRVGAFCALHEREGIELALYGGRSHHATAGTADPGVPHRHVSQRAVRGLAASGRYRAVVCGTTGRLALPAAYAGARAADVPFVLWTALWAYPRTAAWRLAGAPLLRHVERHADAVAAYGPHVADFVRRHGARRVAVAPQAVDVAFWSAPGDGDRADTLTVAFIGRDARAKGLDTLLQAWERVGLGSAARLVLIGVETAKGFPGVVSVGVQEPAAVRNFLAAADVLVMPALHTPEFLEPWGLAANEAMHQGLPVIATDAVGAAAGGLVRHQRNGLVVPAGDAGALAGALRVLADDDALRARLGAAARRDVAAYTHDAWAAGMSRALALATTS